MRMGLILVLLAFFFMLCRAAELEELIGEKHQVFQVFRPKFIDTKTASFFRWTSKEQTEARYPKAGKSKGELTFLDVPVQEVIFRFKGNELSSIYISIYNRGDAGAMSSKQFSSCLLEIDKKICSRLAFHGKPVSRREIVAGATVYGRFYPTGELLYTLKWSSRGSRKKFVPEYIQIEIGKQDPAEDLTRRHIVRSEKGTVSKKTLTENVQTDSKGNVWIDNIPMVDQGMKGYCVAAVTERILRYYGNDNVTQHTIAQIANTDSKRGTNHESLLRALEKAGSKFGLRTKQVYCFPKDYDEMMSFAAKCSKNSKRAGKKKTSAVIQNNMINVDETIRKIPPEIFLKTRIKDSKGLDRFLREIRGRVQKGLPVVWSVILGIAPEEGVSPQNLGGHMRLIIGYNETNKEIIYSDTWGRGHEFKVMPWDNAWAITTCVIFMEPKSSAKYGSM